MNYVDTSVLVAALTKEPHTRSAERWLTSAAGGKLAISDWVLTEFSAALSIKMRVGTISEDRRTAALSAFTILVEESFVIAPITSAHLRTAAWFASDHRLGLRAGDALHLAIANERRATLCTLDKRLAAAGRALKVTTRLI